MDVPKSSVTVTPLVAFVGGSFSSMTTNFLLQPFDTVKTRLIAGAHSGATGDPQTVTHYKGMSRTFLRVVQEESFSGLWKGAVPALWRVGLGGGAYFLFLNTLVPSKKPNQGAASSGEYSMMKLGGSAMISRWAAATLVYPFTVVKTRFEASRSAVAYRGVSDALSSIYRLEGPRALYAGLIPTFLRDGPFSALYLVFYTQLKDRISVYQDVHPMFDSRHGVTQFIAGFVAGGAATLMTQPPDVIRTRLQLNRDASINHRILNSAKAVYQAEGMVGFFRGALPRVLKRSISNGLTWALYEQILITAKKLATPSGLT